MYDKALGLKNESKGMQDAIVNGPYLGICSLVDIIIVNPTGKKLFFQSYITQGFGTSDVVQATQ